MLDALPYDDPCAIPVGILVTYLILLLIKTILKYAQILRTQGPQQTNMAIQENTPATQTVPERDSGKDRLFRPDQPVDQKASKLVVRFNLDSGGDSTTNSRSIDQQSNDTATTDSGTKNKAWKSNLRSKKKAVMVDLPTTHGHTQTVEQVMTVANYLKAVKTGKIPKSPNHAAIQEMSKKPHGTQTQVIVLACKQIQ